jgi:hypothetical protein
VRTRRKVRGWLKVRAVLLVKLAIELTHDRALANDNGLERK